MAFEIGERVTSSWTGPGTVIGPLVRDEDNVPHQMVKLDKVYSGPAEVLRPIAKLLPYVDPPVKHSRRKISKGGGDGSETQSTTES